MPNLDQSSDALDIKLWSERGVRAVLSLWDNDAVQSYRTIEDFVEQTGRPVRERQLRPTVTYSAVAALAEAGVLQGESKNRGSDKLLVCEGAQLEISGVGFQLDPGALFERLFTGTWVPDALDESRHGSKSGSADKGTTTRFMGGSGPSIQKTQRTPSAQETIVLAALSNALRQVARSLPLDFWKTERQRQVQGGVVAMLSRLALIFPPPGLFSKCAAENFGPDGLSPQMAVYAATVVVACTDLARLYGNEQAVSAQLADLRDDLDKYCRREVERQLARSHAPLEAGSDAASLAYALNGWALLHKDARADPLFRVAVEAIVSAQLSDGSWAAGATNYFDGNPMVQPSAEIALQLASAAFDRSSLYRCDRHQLGLMRAAQPALRRHLVSVVASYRTVTHATGTFSGWEDDRVRSNGTVRAYNNALTTRLISGARLLKVALERECLLQKYKPEWPGALGTEPWREQPRFTPGEHWRSVGDPDQTIEPCQQLLERIIEPIARQIERKQYFLRPDKNGVSFILYGPPGSGKTYLLQTFAKALGWPLLSLSPGNFIKDGLERIEATASEIFDDLRQIDHAVVLFDECDELFRDREKTEGSRNILSFATASMLPKLQQLHDARKVIFVLATNYVANLDKAIRRDGRFDLILLYDRPDAAARSKFFQGREAIAAREVAALVGASAGWMTKQILDFRATYEAADAPARSEVLALAQNISVEDYSDWCRKAAAELDAAQVPTSKKQAKVKEWKQFVKPAAPKKAKLVRSSTVKGSPRVSPSQVKTAKRAP